MPFGSIFRSIANLTHWRGAEPNALIGGRVDVSVGAVAAGQIGIKSIQRGYSSVSPTAGATHTITLPTAVVVNKTFLIIQKRTPQDFDLKAEVTGVTTITVTNSDTVSVNWDAEWQVVEFY